MAVAVDAEMTVSHAHCKIIATHASPSFTQTKDVSVELIKSARIVHTDAHHAPRLTHQWSAVRVFSPTFWSMSRANTVPRGAWTAKMNSPAPSASRTIIWLSSESAWSARKIVNFAKAQSVNLANWDMFSLARGASGALTSIVMIAN